MSKLARRMFLPLTTLATLLAVTVVFAPIGRARSSHGDQYMFQRNGTVNKPVSGNLSCTFRPS